METEQTLETARKTFDLAAAEYAELKAECEMIETDLDALKGDAEITRNELEKAINDFVAAGGTEESVDEILEENNIDETFCY